MRNNEYKKEQINSREEKKSSMEIYIYGKYNPIMEIIIGEKKNKKESNLEAKTKKEEVFLNPKEHKTKDGEYILLSSTPGNEKQEDLEERLLNNYEQKFDDKKDDIPFYKKFDNFLNTFESHEDKILKQPIFEKHNLVFNWNINIYCNEKFNQKTIESIKDKFLEEFENDQNKNNLLILFVDSIKSIFNTIEIFSSISSEIHPLFLFIINDKEKNTKDILSKINNFIREKKIKKFNIRNVTILEEVNLLNNYSTKSIKENENVYNEIQKKRYKYICNIYHFIKNSWLYYNNYGDDFNFSFLNEIIDKNDKIKDNEKFGLFNILLLGRHGAGKSTLINILSNSKRSLEGKGESFTKKIIKYIIKDYNICLYDSPGLGLEEDIIKIRNFILDFEDHLLKLKNHIHLVFYLINSNEGRDIYENEEEILKLLMEKNIPIFFLITFSKNENKKDLKEKIELNLKKRFKKIETKIGMEYYKNQIKLFSLGLLDEKEGSLINFGLKDVMNEAYKKFEHCIIDDKCLNKLESLFKELLINEEENKNKIFEILKGNELFKYLKDIDDAIKIAEEKSNKTLKFYYFLIIFSLHPSFFNNKIKRSLLKKIAKHFTKVRNEDEEEDLINNNKNKIMEYERTWSKYIPIINILFNFLI